MRFQEIRFLNVFVGTLLKVSVETEKLKTLLYYLVFGP